ncbi:MAG: ABC transporter permease [Zetaproteobacteria bacterium]|nr:ABC transporter permease [Pseudobdellovibrionaceae bacterium]
MNTTTVISKFGKITLFPINSLQSFSTFCKSAFMGMINPTIKMRLLFQQLEFVGNQSFGIILLAGSMVGAIFGIQLGIIFKIFGAESMIGAAAGFGLSRELAPVIGGFLVTGRAGSAMAAELGTMRVNEQIDAMRVMAVNPYNYLVAPRVIAAILMMPILVIFFVVSGVLASFIIASTFYQVDTAEFLAKIQWVVAPKDLFDGCVKATVFGFIFSTIGCYQGFNASGGAKGVGEATTKAVVISYVAILSADYFITYLQFYISS